MSTRSSFRGRNRSTLGLPQLSTRRRLLGLSARDPDSYRLDVWEAVGDITAWSLASIGSVEESRARGEFNFCSSLASVAKMLTTFSEPWNPLLDEDPS
jgi:hypothetical protein